MANSPSQNPCGRILLVDDNCLGTAARCKVLQELGHQVLTSSTAAEALELCGKHNFDIVVTDYKMPKMNGIELIGRVRKLHPATAVILISGFTDTLGLDEASTGADVVLQKSNNEVSQLVRAVNRLLRKQPPKKPASSQSGVKTEKRKLR
ncbi:MAG: response regulator [Bryobacteraceae bacterium]